VLVDEVDAVGLVSGPFAFDDAAGGDAGVKVQRCDPVDPVAEHQHGVGLGVEPASRRRIAGGDVGVVAPVGAHGEPGDGDRHDGGRRTRRHQNKSPPPAMSVRPLGHELVEVGVVRAVTVDERLAVPAKLLFDLKHACRPPIGPAGVPCPSQVVADHRHACAHRVGDLQVTPLAGVDERQCRPLCLGELEQPSDLTRFDIG
jgi:hypothetical protein